MKKILIFLAVAVMACSCGNAAKTVDSSSDKTDAKSSVRVQENDAVKYTDIYAYLRGRVPGLIVDVDSHEIRIRGVVISQFGDEFPLILVDGVEFSDLSGINPLDVDHVDVIKDGTAGIYGSKASAGVVHIHLKK